MKILITGVTGFVGSKVLEKIKAIYGEDSIIALSSCDISGTKTILSNGYNFSENYLIENGCEDVEVLMHIGAFTPKEKSDANNIELSTGNIINTQLLLKSKLPNLKRIVFISTLDVYEHCVGSLSENTNAIPSTLYGWSKLYCEQMIINHCKQNGLAYEILRLGHVYGEGEEKYRKVMPIMVRNAIEGKNLNIYGDGEAIRSFIYIDDVAASIVNSIELKSSEIINIVSNEPVTINQLAKLILSFTDNDIQIIHTPIDTPNTDYVFDNSKFRECLLKSLTPLKEGLKKEYEYMKDKILS